MNFFSKISEWIGESYTLQMVMKMKNGKMTVSMIPNIEEKKGVVTKKLVPLTVTADPDDLDRTFFIQIDGAMHKVKGLAEAIKEFEKGIDAAVKESKASVDEKSKAKEQAKGEIVEKPAQSKEEEEGGEKLNEIAGEEIGAGIEDDIPEEKSEESEENIQNDEEEDLW